MEEGTKKMYCTVCGKEISVPLPIKPDTRYSMFCSGHGASGVVQADPIRKEKK